MSVPYRTQGCFPWSRWVRVAVAGCVGGLFATGIVGYILSGGYLV